MLTKKSITAAVWILTIVLVLFGQAVSAEYHQADSSPPKLSDEIIVSALNIDEYNPSIAYNSKHHEYLVVWHAGWTLSPSDIRGARVSATGQILEQFVVYESYTRDTAQPDVAYDRVNDRYLVVFIYDSLGTGSNFDLYGVFIPWDGPSSSPIAFPICTGQHHQWKPRVAYARAQEEFLVAWNNEDQFGPLKNYISLQTINASTGNLVHDAVIYSTEHKLNVDVAYNLARNEYLVVYDNGYDIKATRFTGDLMDNFGGEFFIAGWPDFETTPRVAACMDANKYLVTWTSNQGGTSDAIYARFVSGTGSTGNVHKIADTVGDDLHADITCNDAGKEYLVAWQVEYQGKYGITGRLIQPNETLGTAFSIVDPSSSLVRQMVYVAGGKTTYLAAWEHGRSSYQDIHGRLVFTSQNSYLPLIRR